MFWVSLTTRGCTLVELEQKAYKICRQLAVKVGYHFSADGPCTLGFFWHEEINEARLEKVLSDFPEEDRKISKYPEQEMVEVDVPVSTRLARKLLDAFGQ